MDMLYSGRVFQALLPVVVAAWGIAAAAPDARAITFGEPDCTDNLNNLGCRHSNTVSLSGFAAAPVGSGLDGVAFGRCSGSLLGKDDEKVFILTAGHCVSFYIGALQDGTLIDVGVSFDAEIVRDIPAISGSSWSPAQYILGAVPVLPEEYGPQGLNAFNLQFDYGLVVLPFGQNDLVTNGGETVDLTGVDPVTLPEPDFVSTIVDPGDPPILTAVGYGVGEAHNKPGKGGNKGGAVNDLSKLGVRWLSSGTALINFMGQNQNLMIGSQNPARGHEGTCGGDSGGPIFHDDGQGEIQVAVTSSGDAICRGSAIMARTDAPEAQAFIQCALAAGSLEAVAACGCTEVDSQGECAVPKGKNK